MNFLKTYFKTFLKKEKNVKKNEIKSVTKMTKKKTMTIKTMVMMAETIRKIAIIKRRKRRTQKMMTTMKKKTMQIAKNLKTNSILKNRQFQFLDIYRKSPGKIYIKTIYLE